ncbi:30S ribosomal protein S4 [Candidatus Micrarchaeota archaeon RBG_16_49_10]|nr:MAG: 30S ribosomal protein S4 [Candidatus Micrarchaeota archaeon RBG_16_49_10]
MRKITKKYTKPRRPWDKERNEGEKKLKIKYGLRRKREIWKAISILRKFRSRAREIAAKKDAEAEKILIDHLNKLGVLDAEAKLNSVLGLTVEDILKRRMQTVVFEKGLANTQKEARQMITHGHIAVDSRKFFFPSALVTRDMEPKISYYGGFSPKRVEKAGEAGGEGA